MRRPPICPKCQGSMTEGVVADLGYGQWVVASFLPGPFSVSRWWGLKVKKKNLVPTTTYRCTRCSYLESYAFPAE